MPISPEEGPPFSVTGHNLPPTSRPPDRAHFIGEGRDLQAYSVSEMCLEFGPIYSRVILRPRLGYVPKVSTTPFRDQVVTLQRLLPFPVLLLYTTIGSNNVNLSAMTHSCVPPSALLPRIPTTPFKDQVVTLQALPQDEVDPALSLLCPVRTLQLFVCFGKQKGKTISKQRLAYWIVDATALAYQAQKFTIPSTPNTTKSTTAVTSALTSTSTTGTSQSTTTKPPPSTVLTTKAPTAPPSPPTTKPVTVIPTKPLTTEPPTARPVTTTPKSVNRQISLSIDETFDASLQNQNSDKFKKYKSDIEKAIHSSYKDVKGFISATVTGFRPGSVIVDFFITSAEVVQISGEINQAIYTNMKEFNFKVDLTSIAETVNKDLRPRDNVFPEQDIKLSCPATSPLGNVDWKFQGKNIQPSNHYEFSSDHLSLTVKSVTISDNGRYECLYNTATGPRITWDRIDYIKPYPNMQVPTNKIYKCENQQIDVICCVHSDYNIQWVQDKKMLSSKADSLNCITQPFTISSESSCGKKSIFTCKLDNKDLIGFSYSSKAVELVVSNLLPPNSPVTCFDEVYGFGQFGDRTVGDCEKNKVGYLEGVCQSNGLWETVNNNCVLRIIEVLQEESKVVDPETLTDFVIKVNNATTVNKGDIVQSQVTVSTIVEILNNIADVSQNVTLDEVVVTNFLNIVDVISSETTKPVWVELNSNGASQGNSSQLLSAIENVIKATSDSNFNITSPSNSFLFKKVTTSENFRDVLRLNSTAEIFIPNITSTHKNVTITTVAFSSLGNVMPARNRTDNLNKTENVINGLIVVINTSISINNIELSFEKHSNSVTQNNNSVNLGNPQCVFWEFNLFNHTGGWDSTGCEVIRVNDTVTCHCNHTTSFSILMSPFVPEDLALSVITYVGVAVSIASLVVCLIIEMIIWKDVSRNSTSHVRHVSLVNIALSLLIADICFIIGAAVANPGEDYTSSCSAVVFFTHFFYLALFFWMMASALLLLYRTTVVFSQLSKSVMMAVAFIVGYGTPVLISVITVASTAGSKKYVTQNGTCWLNWDDSKALLAFVLPALVTVVVNIIVVIIVIMKMLRRGVGESNRDERKVSVVILRCVVILTPLFGITWGLGLGIMIEPKALALHYLFTIFNSLQGFLILVLGTLMEKRVRQTLKTRLRITRLTGSRATYSSGAQSYSSSNRTTLTDVFNTLLRRGRNARANISSSYNSRSPEGVLNA
ncbi:adhesion G-protein coupled receptor F1-like [Chanodichthys erythropterus]|uniref:adhesion G-protein coupled receptor F1-like n=1 Tax=Chanodichthys erythropterus TaxID=933992 RepID=UPI00351F30EA